MNDELVACERCENVLCETDMMASNSRVLAAASLLLLLRLI